MLPEPVPRLYGRDACQWAERWGIDYELAEKLVVAQRNFSLDVANIGFRIRSGFRSVEEQRELERAGRPTAPEDLSTHTSCPATGADLDLVGVAVTQVSKIHFGRSVVEAGLRWGGGSPVNEVGIPSDWNHVDLGPRAR